MSYQRLLSSAHLFVCSIAAVALAAGSFWRLNQAIYVYFFALLVLIMVTLLWDVTRKGEARDLVPRHDIYLAAGICFVSAMARFYHLGLHPIWLDEYQQVAHTGIIPEGIIEGAARHQQPPLDYLFTQLSIWFGGPTEIAARFFPALWGSCIPGAFYLLLRWLKVRPLLAIVGGVLLTFDSSLVYYAQEGRPYSLGAFLGVLYLAAIIRFAKSRLFRDAVFIVIGGLLFLIAFGLQPAIAIGTVCVVALPLVFWRSYTRSVLIFIVANELAVVLFLPFLILTFQESRSFLNENVDLSTTYILSAIDWRAISALVFAKKYSLFPFVLIPFAGLVLWWKSGLRASGEKPERFYGAALALILAFLVIFPPLFLGFYHVFVHWPLTPRYYIVYLLVVALGIVLSLQVLSSMSPAAGKWHYLLYIVLIFATLGLQGHSFITEGYREKYVSNYREIYADLARDAPLHSAVVPLTLQKGDRWTPEKFLYREFYDHSQNKLLFSFFVDGDAVIKDPTVSTIFFISVPEFNLHNLKPEDFDFLKQRFPDLTYKTYKHSFLPDAYVIRIPSEGDYILTLKRFFQAVLERFGNDEGMYHVRRQVEAI